MQMAVLQVKVFQTLRRKMVVHFQTTGRLPLFVLVFSFLLLVSPLHANPKVACEIKEIARHQSLVTFSWHVIIQSDKVRDGCDLRISFRDSKGEEIYFVRETIALNLGRSVFSGTEVCALESWKRVVKYITTLDCVF